MRRVSGRVGWLASGAVMASIVWSTTAARAEDGAPPADLATVKCRVHEVGAAQRSQDNAAKTVTFQGSVENTGEAVAKGVHVRLQVLGGKDEFALGDQTVVTEPRDIGPGATGTFEVTASWAGQATHGGAKEVRSLQVESCEAVAEVSAITGNGYCELKFVGQPSSSTSGSAATALMRGEIQNDGPGVASGITVALGGAAKDGKVKGASAKVTPETLAPGSAGKFELEVPTASGSTEGALSITGYDCQPAPPAPTAPAQ